MAALPFVFITEDLHAISANLIQQGQQPPNIQITKYFFKPHIEDIKKEFFQVKAMGTGTAEEWFKGLDNTGREKLAGGRSGRRLGVFYECGRTIIMSNANPTMHPK
jgi:hypothetical protein